MAGRIYPSGILVPNTPLGYDGSDFRVLRVDNINGYLKVKGVDQLFTFKDVLHLNYYVAATGTIYSLPSAAVPVGQVWMVTTVIFLNSVGNTGLIYFAVVAGGLEYFVQMKNSSLINEGVQWQGNLFLKAGEYIQGAAYDVVIDQAIRLSINGYIMSVEPSTY